MGFPDSPSLQQIQLSMPGFTLLCTTSSRGTDWALLSSFSLSLFFLRLLPRLKRETWRQTTLLLSDVMLLPTTEDK